MIGLSIAWKAAAAGLDVTVADPLPGRGAGWAAAGMLAPAGEAHFGEDTLTALNVAAARAWPDFAAALEGASGGPVHYVDRGTLLVAVDSSDRTATDDLLAYQQSIGLRAHRLGAADCRASEPLLAPGIRGGADLSEDHQVDNRAVLDGLVAACRATGVALVEDEVDSIEIYHGSATGITTGRGDRLPAGAVVVAAGCRSGHLGGIPDHLLPPVRPVKGLTLRLRAGKGTRTLRRTVRGVVHGRHCYLVPRGDGTVVVGATVEEKGFDTSVQVGAVGDLLQDARRLIPCLEEYELFDTTAGLRPGSPDNAPLVGRTEVRGLVMATGHYRNGFLLAPVTAAEIVRILGAGGGAGAGAGAGAEADFGPFSPGRFIRPAVPGPQSRPAAAPGLTPVAG